MMKQPRHLRKQGIETKKMLNHRQFCVDRSCCSCTIRHMVIAHTRKWTIWGVGAAHSRAGKAPFLTTIHVPNHDKSVDTVKQWNH